MKLKLIVISILGLTVAACDPNYDSQSISSEQREDKAVTGGPDFRKWMLPDEEEIIISGPTTTTTTTTTMPEAFRFDRNPAPKGQSAPEVKPPPKTEPAPKVTPTPRVKKNPLAGRLPISYPRDFKEAGVIKPTVYFIPLVNETEPTCKEEQKISMYSRDGKVLARVCPNTYESCALQGSCFVTTKEVSTILNHNGYFNGRHHFFEVDMEHCPFGQGVRSGCLDPFYTVAADLSLFKAGDVIYVPGVAGTLLPNGETHHGYFIVRDTGGVIDGAGRFDFFSGFSSWRDKTNPFNKLKLINKGTQLPYYNVTGETAEIVRKVRNFPSLPGF